VLRLVHPAVERAIPISREAATRRLSGFRRRLATDHPASAAAIPVSGIRKSAMTEKARSAFFSTSPVRATTMSTVCP
jgi:hypothetical protein